MSHPCEIRPSDANAINPDEILVFLGQHAQRQRRPALPPARLRPSCNSPTSGIPGIGSAWWTPIQSAARLAGEPRFIPLPPGTGLAAGLLWVDLPLGIRNGDDPAVTVRQVTDGVASPASIISRRPAASLPPGSFLWRRVSGAFQFSINISAKEQLLLPEERLLAVLRWMQTRTPPAKRWLPVLQRYIAAIAGQVQGFGGDPSIPPSQSGDVPGKFPPVKKPPPSNDISRTGKIESLVFDHFGDFEGFILETGEGDGTPVAAQGCRCGCLRARRGGNAFAPPSSRRSTGRKSRCSSGSVRSLGRQDED